jgi:ribosomal protein S18 acetylase RimI-like enzyme
MRIEKAVRADLTEILSLQYLAYQSEAEILNDYTIQPLTQTLEEVEAEFSKSNILKALNSEGSIIGSVRGRIEGETCYIFKLFVHPDYQGKGVGKHLMHQIEKACPCGRYELFTSIKSLRNLGFYESVGYLRYKETAISPGLTMVYLEKRSTSQC